MVVGKHPSPSIKLVLQSFKGKIWADALMGRPLKLQAEGPSGGIKHLSRWSYDFLMAKRGIAYRMCVERFRNPHCRQTQMYRIQTHTRALPLVLFFCFGESRLPKADSYSVTARELQKGYSTASFKAAAKTEIEGWRYFLGDGREERKN